MTNTDNSSKLKLKKLLKDLFQFDKKDLDFGIYKIMNEKRDLIENFIEKDLLKVISDEFNKYKADDNSSLLEELENLKKQFIELWVEDYETKPKYQEKLALVKKSETVWVNENDVYDHIYKFFSRYYDGWDFYSKRRFGKDKYVVPYNWEEVMFHWANSDQYYIKTGENFKNYSFKIEEYTVNFNIKDVETDKNNNKSDEKRFFVLSDSAFSLENNVLNISFEYRWLSKDEEKEYAEKIKELTKKTTVDQWNINLISLNSIFDYLEVENTDLKTKLETLDNEKTILEKHLNKYTKRNTEDFFIHKNIWGFLKQELDFYIKNEVMNIDDIGTDNEKDFRDLIDIKFSQIKVIKGISKKIIEFIEQLENYQKKLFEKKKFVIDSEYCFTLDKVSSDLYDDILDNEKQIQGWKDLWFIEENFTPDKKYLEENQTLVVDTKNFSEDFKIKVLSSFDNIEEELNWLLINSENFQALNLLLEKYKWKVKCIYIDPPFNLWQNWDFLYKTNYLNSSWTTLLENRISLAKELLSEDWSIFVRCDYHWNYLVRQLLDKTFWSSNFMNELIVWKSNRIKTKWNKYLSWYDNIFYYARNINKLSFNHLSKKSTNDWWRWMDKPWEVWSIVPEELIKFFSKENLKLDKEWRYTSRAKIILWKECVPPENSRYPSQETILKMEKEWKIKLNSNWTPQMKRPDTVYLTDNWTDLFWYSNTTGFTTENSEELLKRVIETSSLEGDIVLDFFVWSWTTQAVAHKLWRKWIWSEMWEYFYDYPLKRFKNVLFWDNKWISKDIKWSWWGFFRYQKLEQYEDTLNNLKLDSKKAGNISLLDENWDVFIWEARNEYFFKYMLEEETKQSILDIDKFSKPFSYKLLITEKNEAKERDVNLVDTFNYLLGIDIIKYKKQDDFIVIEWVKVEENKTEKYLIIWREYSENDMKNDNEKLKDFFSKNYNENDFDKIFVNGDSFIEKAEMIEEEFKKKMFS